MVGRGAGSLRVPGPCDRGNPEARNVPEPAVQRSERAPEACRRTDFGPKDRGLPLSILRRDIGELRRLAALAGGAGKAPLGRQVRAGVSALQGRNSTAFMSSAGQPPTIRIAALPSGDHASRAMPTASTAPSVRVPPAVDPAEWSAQVRVGDL